MDLIIVESPTKARTFNRLLKGKDFFVFATLGHIRDLPHEEIGIDFTHNFNPRYTILKNKEKVRDKLVEGLKKYKSIILATDPDREGESISYHVAATLGFIREKWPDFQISDDSDRLKRIVFHEITYSALKEALAHPTKLRVDLVKAQQARRIIDRIVGYKLSPLLWEKTGKNWLSAGRVQTVALRLIVEREKERRAFKEEDYFIIHALFNTKNGLLKSELVEIPEKPIKQNFKINVFDGEYEYSKTIIDDKLKTTIESDLKNDSFNIIDIEHKDSKKYPPPPFTTSLLQQDAFFKYGFTSKMVMRLAQDLYEAGLITYHRTDSFNLSTHFVFKAKDYIQEEYGDAYMLEKPRGYRTRSKLAQEAHEAIRPTKLILDLSKSSSHLSKKIGINHKRLYDLIFKRSVATQMKEADISIEIITIQSGKKYVFKSENQNISFDGFLRLYNKQAVLDKTQKTTFSKEDNLTMNSLESTAKKTQPPYPYNEATLIKTLEEKGIGRPSTYAPIISLIQEKGYVEKDGRYFHPTLLGEPICDYLSANFSPLFDLDFTSRMEDDLDNIANGSKPLLDVLSTFYTPFENQLTSNSHANQKIEIKEETTEPCPICGKKQVVKVSRFGKFFACSGYPNCKYVKSIQKKVKNAVCPKCSGDIVVKYTKSKKRFYGCSNYPQCTYSSWTYKDIKLQIDKNNGNVKT